MFDKGNKSECSEISGHFSESLGSIIRSLIPDVDGRKWFLINKTVGINDF